MQNEQLFSTIYFQYWDDLFRIAKRKTGCHDSALDIVQETFTYVWQNFSTLQITEDKVRSYLITCLYYRILNSFREKGINARQRLLFQQYMESAGNTVSPESSLEAERELEAIQIAIAGELDKMPERMKAIFVDAYYKNRSVEEISASYNISPKTVRNQLSEAKSRLKEFANNYSSPEWIPLFVLLLNDAFSNW